MQGERVVCCICIDILDFTGMAIYTVKILAKYSFF